MNYSLLVDATAEPSAYLNLKCVFAATGALA